MIGPMKLAAPAETSQPATESPACSGVIPRSMKARASMPSSAR
jgi:hypothetical protein